MVRSTENSFKARFLPDRVTICERQVRGPYGSVSEFVVTGVAFADVELSIDAVDGEAVGGSE